MSYSLGVLFVFDFITCYFVWINNITYSNEFYGSIASQAQTFTFLVKDHSLGANVRFAQRPIGLGKYLMRFSIEKVIFKGEIMRFWDLRVPRLKPLKGFNSLDLSRPKKEIQSSQKQCSTKYDSLK